jgi:hypothetical protein
MGEICVVPQQGVCQFLHDDGGSTNLGLVVVTQLLQTAYTNRAALWLVGNTHLAEALLER